MQHMILMVSLWSFLVYWSGCMAVPVVGGHHADGFEKILKGSLVISVIFGIAWRTSFH